LVRELAGDGVVEMVVTADDVKKPMPDSESFQTALWELGVPAENALAVTGSAAGLRAATSAGLATVVITGAGALEIPAAVAVRPDYDGGEPMRIADCQRLHGRFWAGRSVSAA
jgi:beta-phosphoglucomutase-like phosphatase (HAD superfamily)